LSKTADDLPPLRAAKNIFTDVRIRAARHDEEIRRARNGIADPVQRDAIHKAVGDAMRVLLNDEVSERRDVTNQIADNSSPMFRLGASDSARNVSGRKGVRRDNSYRGVAAEQGSDLPSGVFPGNWAPAGHAGVQGEPS